MGEAEAISSGATTPLLYGSMTQSVLMFDRTPAIQTLLGLTLDNNSFV